MSQPIDFQTMILRLQEFWSRHNCLIWQPYHTEVGAGTMNPATYLRVLGPEPWNVAYVEPSLRPDDGRYGENPNRFYQHYQFQVILKPDPGNPQELYLQSLAALGIDPRKHDIRFVEDNWTSPALGAWGLGWEVWLDGQEITQYTYFQQAGGAVLDPVAVELTYGLERIAIALQGVRDFRGVQWNQHVKYADIHLQSEREFSKYAFEIGDVERLRQSWHIYEAEAEAALAEGLVLPAHDYILKCSHTFNLLDTRGAVGVTERQGMFGRMRDLSRRVAVAYLEQRQALEYPMLDESAAPSQAAPVVDGVAAPAGPADLLIEIGVEELPATEVSSALEQFKTAGPAMLNGLRLAYTGLEVYATPRRLVLHVKGLQPRQSDLEQTVKGPPVERAYDALGVPTKAAEGFARSRGVQVSDLQVVEMDGGRYVAAQVRESGRPAAEVLPEALTALTAGLKFEKSMRWNSTNVAFSRPVRWLLALLGEAVVPFQFAGLTAGRTTRGLRFYAPEEQAIHSQAEYFDFLHSQGILLDINKRQQVILEQVKALAASVDGSIAEDPDLLEEVANLVETPTALLGNFEAEYLELPREVLIGVMKKKQRYFPVQTLDGSALKAHFITVRNGDDQGVELVRQGNADVIRARFADAAFFIRNDRRLPLDAYASKLSTLLFQRELGSMLDKTGRITKLVDVLAGGLDLTPAEQRTAQRAAELAKADLATQMVVEMTALQGVMGRYYAKLSGETPDVAQAIYEHYLPRYTGDAVPAGKPGLLVGIADRLDTLAGLFAVGLAPTGAKDPFALRRVAIGLVQALIHWKLDFDVRAGLRAAGDLLPVRFDADELDACHTFIVERLRNLLIEQGMRFDVVDAVLAAQGSNPAGAARAVHQLQTWVGGADWPSLLAAYARCVRITRDKSETYEIQPEALQDPAEQALWQAVRQAQVQPRQPGSVDDFLNTFTPLAPVINTFFDKVLVMADDPVVRGNRLGLLQQVAGLAAGAADLARLEGF